MGMQTLDDLLYKNKNEITLSVPKAIDCYSVNMNREVLNNISGLRYFIYPSELDLDLNEGFDNFIKKPESAKNEKLDHLLQIILKNKILLNLNKDADRILDTDFLCFRGLFTKIMRTPFDKDTWTLCAVKFKDTIYLCEFNNTEKVFHNSDLYTYYGHSFEKYTLFDSPQNAIKNEQPVNECEEFCVFFRSHLNDLKLLYGAEVDGVISDEIYVDKNFLSNANFVELKTNTIITNRKQDFNFHRHKLLKFWAQSYLVGINRIIVGYRNQDGIIQKVSPLTVSDLENKCNKLWNSRTCLKFLYEFLSLVKQVLNDCDNQDQIWKFKYSDKRIIYEKVNDVEYKFLPSWYKDEINKIIDS